MNRQQSILIIGLVWPEPNSSAAGSRMLQLIRLFKEQGWGITFASAAAKSEFSFDLHEVGVTTAPILLNDSSFDFFVKEVNPDIVLFDRFVMEEQFGWRVAEQRPSALRILDTEDLHCLRLARQKAFQEQRQFGLEDLFSDTAKREIASILRSDLSLIISDFEMDLLQNHFKINAQLLYYLPFLVDKLDAKKSKEWPSFEERSDFVFIGNFLHEPNCDAVLYLKTAIWPLILKAIPEASLKIYGGYPPSKIKQLHQPKTHFAVEGRVENAAKVIQNARVVLAPLRFGAGTKGKLLEAMQCGTPSVTTSIGAESMAGTLPWNGFIEDNPQAFADSAITLYQNEQVWENAQKNGISIVNQRYSNTLYEGAVIAHIVQLQTKLATHRLANFMGAVLLHHTMGSTKYMSKWIEAKNKI